MSSGDDEAAAPGDAAVVVTVSRWSEAKRACCPTQKDVGWDWTLYKLAHFVTRDEAQAYMARKPVPFVAYRGRYYVVDHHHTLVGSTPRTLSALSPFILHCSREMSTFGHLSEEGTEPHHTTVQTFSEMFFFVQSTRSPVQESDR